MSGEYHFIGIGGIGMSALARLMLKKKAQVSGSDLNQSYMTQSLMQEGAKIFIGHSAANISPNTTVIFSTDIQPDNPEYQAALHLNCPLKHRSDLLAEIASDRLLLAVAGTHGKTTTSALLAWVLASSGHHPSFAVGGLIPQFQSNADHGNGQYFVAEACESDGTFLKYNPFGAIITNIDLDHMNYFGTEMVLKEFFERFISKVHSHQHLFWCGDDVRLLSLKPAGISYGFSPRCDWRIVDFTQSGWQISLDAIFQGVLYPKIEVSLIGRHNALNALAVFGLALALGIDEAAIRHALRTFGGVKRRCEIKGEKDGILFLDDYAHHPTEIAATLQGIRYAFPERRLVAIYQPHRYSRTKDCLGTFGNIFDEADALFITDIYAAGETPIPGLCCQQIIFEVELYSNRPCFYLPRNELGEGLANYLKAGDVFVSLGAGDITRSSNEIMAKI